MGPDVAPRVSVIIPTLNRTALLREALASVRALEDHDLSLEVIVADNGSIDDSESVAREFGARFVRATTLGPAAARNAGLRAATGEFIAFLDDDDVWLPGHLRPHLAMLAARPDLTAVLGQIVPADAALNPSGLPYPARLQLDGDVFLDLLQHWTQIGAIVARASVLQTVGFFDEALIAAEEWDWQLRLALSHKVGFVAAPCMLFRGRAPHLSGEARMNFQRNRYNRRVFWRNVQRSHALRRHPLTISFSYLRYNIIYSRYLLNSVIGHVAAGEPASARAALGWACRISAPYVIWAAVRHRGIRVAVVAALLPKTLTSHTPLG